MTDHFDGLVQALQWKVASLNKFYEGEIYSVTSLSIVMCNLWHNLQLVEGSQVLDKSRSRRSLPLVELEKLNVPEHLSSSPVFSGVCVTLSLDLCVCFVDRCLSLCTFSFGHCVVCSSSIYGFWLHLWYFQTLLVSFSLYTYTIGLHH